MAVSQQTRKAHIRFSTDIIKRLGEELNPSIEQSILELVKNPYDADAKECTVRLDDIASEGGTIVVSDDGSGMDEADIEDGWLVLGSSSKSASKKTALGRIPAGSKGLGRLAAIRLGTNVSLRSISGLTKRTGFSTSIDWTKFDKVKLVSDFVLEIKAFNAKTQESTGTTITIENVKQKIGLREIRKVARGLILLADPFEDDPNSFKPTLVSSEYKQIAKLVEKRYFEECEYHLVAKLDNKGIASASVLDYRGNELFSANHKKLAEKRGGERFNCPAATFELWSFLLSSTTFATKTISIGEIQEWLKEFGGVHFYENGLRVNPYGNPGNDWLELNLSRSRSPEERPSTNNSIGIVRVKESKGLLTQKTDRSGFIENDVFYEIKEFCKASLDWMAKQRLAVTERQRRANRERTASQSVVKKHQVVEVIRKLPSRKQQEVEKAFTKYEKARDEEVKTLRAEVQLYRTLSTAGITAATFSHEARGNPIKAITYSTKVIDKRVQRHLPGKYEDLFKKSIENILGATESLSVLGTVTLKLIEHEKRRLIKVNLHEVIQNIITTFTPFTKGHDILLRPQYVIADPFLRGTESAIESIVANLLNNSITALEDSTKERVIEIKTTIEKNTFFLTVSDNGPGIEGISLKNIWLPGQTTNPNGTGLGLTIVRDAVHDLGGKVRAHAKGSLGGAEIIVELPLIGY